MSTVIALNALSDNYIWVIHGQNNKVIVVDPGEAQPVLNYLQAQHMVLEGIVLTHHHPDHSGGILDLLKHYPHIPVYSSQTDKVAGVTQCVQEGEEIRISPHFSSFKVLEIPGHTLGHIAFLYENAVFSGDTLFSCGCGKIFEGTAQQMYISLSKLKQLPPHTLIYCGHEYTLSNIAFAQTVEPENTALALRKKEVEALRKNNQPSLPVTVEVELQTNPFLRCEEPSVIQAVQKQAQITTQDPVEVLFHLRQWKNNYK